tara:strand:+ start:71 stop:643 length:573 start_codon:yes stop_codon:yes gene_type:complete
MTYKVIRNFIDKNTTDLLYKHSILLDQRLAYLRDKEHDPNTFGTFNDGQVPGAFSIYAEPIFETLLLSKKNTIQNIIGQTIYPGYSYLRVYKQGSELKKHKDRPACEITLSLCLGNDGLDWPLSLATDNGVEHLVLNPGDGLLYDGRKIEHWRDPFEGNLQAQVFLHYVTKEQSKFDSRPTLGLPDKYKK